MVTGNERGICRCCGDTRVLDADGLCRWTHGCEHRVFQHEERMRRLVNEMRQREKALTFTQRYGNHPAVGPFMLGLDWYAQMMPQIYDPRSFLDLTTDDEGDDDNADPAA